MLECLVINDCGNTEFVSRIVEDVFSRLDSVIKVTYYEAGKFHNSCDIALFLPKYEYTRKAFYKTFTDMCHDIQEETIKNYKDIRFQCYVGIMKAPYEDGEGHSYDSTLIYSNTYNMDKMEYEHCGQNEKNYFTYRFEIESAIALFITKRVNDILVSRYLESERYKYGNISHSIEFSPEHYQAGLGILNYFGTVIRHRYPEIPVTVRIEQEDLTVRMIIQTSEGHRETVEHTLQAYGLVIAGKMLPEEFLSDPYHVLELKHKLELTQTELRLTHNLLQIAERQNQDQQHRLLSIESEMANLRQLIGDSLQTTRSAQQHAQKLTGLLQPLLTNLTAQHDAAVQQALDTLKGVIERGITTQDEQTVKEALVTLQEKEPGVFRQMLDLLGKGAITGTAGRLLYDWLMHLNVILR
jgi:hypothetical protein